MPTDTEINRAVSLKLGIWKQGEECHDMNCAHLQRRHLSVGYAGRSPHDIPPPDLLSPSGADLLMTTLINRKLRPSFDGDECYITDRQGIDTIHGSGRTWIHALRDAAYKLCEEKQS